MAGGARLTTGFRGRGRSRQQSSMRAALGRAALPDGLDGTSKRTAAVTDGLGTVERVDFAMVHVGTTMVSAYRTDSVGLTLPGVLVADDSQTPAKATPHGFAGWVKHRR